MSPRKSWPTEDSGPDAEEPVQPPPGYGPVAWRPNPSKRRIPPWLQFVAGIVVLALIPVGIWYFSRPPDPRASARGMADLVAKSVTDGDIAAFRSSICDQTLEVPDFWVRLGAATVLAVSDEKDDFAKATLTLDQQGGDLALLLNRTNGSWCLLAPERCSDAAPSTPLISDLSICRQRPGRPFS